MFGFAESIPLYLALSALAGAGASLIAPSQQAALADVVGQERSGGPALAAFQMMGDLGGFAGPIVAGLVADRFGFGAAFAVSGVLTLAAVVPWLLAPETLDRS